METHLTNKSQKHMDRTLQDEQLQNENAELLKQRDALREAMAWLIDCAADLGADEIQLKDSRAALALCAEEIAP